MKAIETCGIVDQDGHLMLKGRIALPKRCHVRVIILAEDEEDPSEEEWLAAAARNSAFDFLADPEEEIYTKDDGRPIHDSL